MNTNDSSLTRMFSCPAGYEMTEEEQRFDQASNEERSNTIWSWTRSNHEIMTPPREMTAAVPMAPPRLKRQTAMGFSNMNEERPPSRMHTDEPPSAPPRLTRQETYYPPPPVLIRENAMEPIYREDLEEQIIELRAQMMEMRAQMMEMRAQMSVLLQKIETKK